MRLLWLIAFLLIVAIDCLSQNTCVSDSLFFYLTRTNSVEQKALIYNRFARNKYLLSDPVKFQQCINKVFSLTTNDTIISEALMTKGHYYSKVAANTDSAIFYYQKSLSIKKSLGDQKGIAANLNGLGISYWYSGDSKKGIDLLLKSATICEQLHDSNAVADSYNNIGGLLSSVDQVDEGISYLEAALAIRNCLSQSQEEKIAGVLSNLALVFAEKKKDYDKAREYTLKSIEINRKYNNMGGLALNYATLSSCYNANGKYEDALLYSKRSLAINRSLGKINQQIGNLCTIATIYFRLGKHKEALEFYNASLDLANKHKARTVISDLNFSLYELFLDQKDYKRALEYYQKYILQKDSFSSAESTHKTKQLLSKYESEKNKQLLETMKKEKDARFYKLALITYSIVGFCVIFVFLLVVFFIRKNARQKKEMEKAQQKNLFETIVQTQEEERKKAAEDIHDGLGQLLIAVKMSIINSCNAISENRLNDAKILLNSGLDITEDALFETKNISRRLLPPPLKELGLVNGIQQMVERNNLCTGCKTGFYTFSIPKNLSTFLEINTFRICQELISNTNKHSKATESTLQLFFRNNSLIVQMDDNGVGFIYDPYSVAGLGLQNIKSRVKMLGGDLQIDSNLNKGTVIIIEIPLNHY